MEKLKLEELNRLSPEDFKVSPKMPVVVVLDNLRSMHNVGSTFRTGDAFAIEKICLCGITACPPHREIRKTAIGAEETVLWEYFENTESALQKLKDEGFIIMALEQTNRSKPLTEISYDNQHKYAFVFGNEVFGVEDNALALCDEALEIPQYGTKHSLNVSVTVGVTLWDYVLKTKKPH